MSNSTILNEEKIKEVIQNYFDWLTLGKKGRISLWLKICQNNEEQKLFTSVATTKPRLLKKGDADILDINGVKIEMYISGLKATEKAYLMIKILEEIFHQSTTFVVRKILENYKNIPRALFAPNHRLCLFQVF